MNAIDELYAAVSGLNAAATILTSVVDGVVNQPPGTGPSEAQIAAITQTVNAVNQALTTQTNRLRGAFVLNAAVKN